MEKELDEIFDSFDKKAIFKDKFILQAGHKPDVIPHREEQIKQIAAILAPVLRGERTSNLFLYGKSKNTGNGMPSWYVHTVSCRTTACSWCTCFGKQCLEHPFLGNFYWWFICTCRIS